MVYESDYSTRRLYTGSRPVVSTSYSYAPYGDLPAAVLRRPDLFVSYAPGSGKGRKQHRVIIQAPRIVHQRLTSVAPPPRRHRATNVYDALEYGRSGNQFVLVNYRASPSPVPVPRTRVTYIEDITNGTNLDEIGRETRSMQRDMDSMLYRVNAGMSFSPSSLYMPSYRTPSEVKEVADMRRLYVRDQNPGIAWGPLSPTNLYRMPLIYQPDPAAVLPKHYFIGRQNLACLSFYGGRPIPKRRRFYPGYEDKVLDDVTFRSFYTKVRNAANSATNAAKKYLRSSLYQPIHYSRKTILGENAEPKREIKESKWVQRAMANEKEPTKKALPVVKQDSVKETSVPVRETLKHEPVRPINVTLPSPRKSITEIIQSDVPKVENLPEESITVKRPQMETVPGTPPIDAKVEETFKMPIKPKDPTPPPKEPTPPPKEPTPPPREPTPPPPPKEKTPPPPKEPTPPPKEPTPPPKEATPPPPKEPEADAPAAQELGELAVPVAEEAGGNSEVPSASGGDSDNKGEVEDDENITLDEVCDVDAENDLENDVLEEDGAETAPEVVEENATSPEVEEEAAEPAEEEVVQPTAEVQEETVESPVLEEETPVGVSILVADIDGPVEVDPELTNDAAPIMSVEEIQAEAERRRTEFARLLEEHHDLVEKVDLLEHQTEDVKLEPVPEDEVPQQPQDQPPATEVQENQDQPQVPAENEENVKNSEDLNPPTQTEAEITATSNE